MVYSNTPPHNCKSVSCGLYGIGTFLIAIPFATLLKRKRKDMWLICEDYNEARDNGYWLYRYIRQNHKEQDVVYAINKKSVDYKKVVGLGEVIQYGSFKHWIYYLAASKNISSQKGGKYYGELKETIVLVFFNVNLIDNNRMCNTFTLKNGRRISRRN